MDHGTWGRRQWWDSEFPYFITYLLNRMLQKHLIQNHQQAEINKSLSRAYFLSHNTGNDLTKWKKPFCQYSPVLLQATITNYHRLGGLNNRNIFLDSSGSCEVQDQSASMVQFWWGPTSESAGGHILAMSSHDREQREKKLSGVSSYKGTNPIMRAPPSWISTSQTPHLQITSHCRLGFLHMTLRGTQIFSPYHHPLFSQTKTEKRFLTFTHTYTVFVGQKRELSSTLPFKTYVSRQQCSDSPICECQPGWTKSNLPSHALWK